MVLPLGWVSPRWAGDEAVPVYAAAAPESYVNHLTQEFGTLAIAVGFVFLWQARRAEHSRSLHWLLTLYLDAGCVHPLGRAAGAHRLLAAWGRQFHSAAGVADPGPAVAAQADVRAVFRPPWKADLRSASVQAGLKTRSYVSAGFSPPDESHGSANTTTCVVVLGFSSGVRRSVDVASPDGPVATATYCLPSTANVIG